ncbi:tRNA (N6-threonylcarbamoyladenosine(37)-N6)-methyltransferase TrmO [Desulfobotulus sp. H1]|uniref:tRNA (N6-threonylcarbamoyladenosine(37)-N6)-methyltransferase TrmO n=1 Tax=Desulfobotulus pelophilus TaxID=2823377 RepID=A0ABT3N5S0_9BACT|nr:tRNA (N6-threonylcarbamoyladenosine(37)-N6)-methyltransferase TrmO [Desulfobotulus pelophilus]MCW7752800.1 tRNA (N6-threonylcarbamoyladenosine(37)-N6)-methyltransferase TrmO [Desulfobotulus pelophilus]
MNSLLIPCIGTIYSPFSDLQNMPIQPVGAADVEGTVVIMPAFVDGLKDLDGFSHLYLFYFFHGARQEKMRVVPFMDTEERGVFSTRSPLRPSHLGMSVVELLEVKGAELRILGVDVLNGTPLVDIKPYIPAFDHRENVRTGWMTREREGVVSARSDHRFV